MVGDFTHEELRLIHHALNAFQHNTGYRALINKVDGLVEHSNFGYGPQLPKWLQGHSTTCHS